ncbi:MAG: UvrD-helicase domain-containing protein [Gammaproteobacteria bacterium]
MSLPPLTLIPAGAGSGKTYTIQQRLGEWVAQGLVKPERIVAVTFTEAAAGELRERIRARLIGDGRLDDALRLDQAYISTIHAFGQRLLAEFAFEHGSSPRPRLLDDDEKKVLVRQAIAQTDKVVAITADLARFGYTHDPVGERSAEDVFRDDMLRLLGLLRALGWTAANPAYGEQAAAFIAAHYGAVTDGKRLTRALARAVRALLEAFPESFAERFAAKRTVAEAFQRDFRNLHAALEPRRLDYDWKVWAQLAELRLSKQGAALPERYDELARAVSELAAELPLHPGPLASAQDQARTMIAAAQDVLLHYAAAKRDAGLVDYEDMVALANALLGAQPAVLQTLLGRVDCLVVDEFQDTNPLQFALVWHLRAAGVPTLVVGDMKQAIMGFQGADPRLFEALLDGHAAACAPLRANWRSQPAVMAFVNALGDSLFPGAYVHLEPRARESTLGALEVVHFTDKPKRNAHYLRGRALAERVAALLDDPTVEIHDRHLNRTRRLRGSDIAVLCPTHGLLAHYARALRDTGLQARLQEPGWLASRAVQIALAALACVANPSDRHAALYLDTTELGSRTLEDGIRDMIEHGQLDSPLLERLRAVAAASVEATVYTVVADTLAALDLFDVVMTWPGARQARANLLRLQAEAGAFMDAQREALAYGGFHGSGLPTFLAWVHERADNDDTRPVPAVVDAEAVELVTWHSAKGREWPVVVVAGMERALRIDLPRIGLAYDGFDDFSNLLGQATIEYAPKFAAKTTNERFLERIRAAAEVEAKRLLYVALTRAREKLVLEWSSHAVGGESITYRGLLSGECGVAVEDDVIRVGDQRFPCVVHDARLEDDDVDGDAATPSEALVTFGRRALPGGKVASPGTPDSVTASGMAAAAEPVPVRSVTPHRYAAPLELAHASGGTALGTALHRCYEVLGAAPGRDDWLPAILGAALDDPPCAVVADHVAAFEAWLAATWPGAEVLREWPVLAARADGTVLSGTIDVLVRQGDAAWVIDHKSDRVTDTASAAAQYLPQLEAYAQALRAQGITVAGLGLHWIRLGLVEFIV